MAFSTGSPNNEALADESSSSDLSFFPEEMDEEEEEYGRGRNGRAKSYANGFRNKYNLGSDNGDNFNDRSRPQKKNASQKRQSQRDARRARDNPNRSQRDEEGERIRKVSDTFVASSSI